MQRCAACTAGLLALTVGLAPACFWEGRSGLDASAFESLGFEDYRRSLVGYCQNDADLARLNDPEFDIETEVTTCTYDCLLEEQTSPCITACVVHNVGLSEECARCYGDSTACTISSCINDCVDGDSPACKACRDLYCTSAFDVCTG